MTEFDRRKLVGMSGLVAGAAAMGAMPVEAAQAKASAGTRKPMLVKLGCQSGPATDEHFAFLARYGIKNIVASAVQSDRKRPYPTVEELKALRTNAATHGLSVDMTNCSFMTAAPISQIMLGLPGRDVEIENFKVLLKNCAEAGIPALKYNLPIMPILRSSVVAGRGDSYNHRWRLSEMQGSPMMTAWDEEGSDSEFPGFPNHLDGAQPAASIIHGASDRSVYRVSDWERIVGKPTAEELWARIDYFLERVVPVATQYKVRMALHPEDCGVPPEGYHGVPQVLGTIEGLKRFVTTQDSPYHGLAFCQGTISEDLTDPRTQVYEVIRWFGSRKKIFLVHFRNVRGHRDDVLVEIFPDEGDVDMVKALRAYRDVGYDGMLVADHIPMGPPSSGPANWSFCYGYIRGLLQSAAEV
ncbi:MAG: D-mannonate dehydratase [Alphaproteobacteria bacterium]|nr:D-mannonate dehydratase [Alphaproteobacteria bacterium]